MHNIYLCIILKLHFIHTLAVHFIICVHIFTYSHLLYDNLERKPHVFLYLLKEKSI